MASLSAHSHSTEHSGPGATFAPTPGSDTVDWRASLRRAEHACCCPGYPAVVVIMPAAPGRDHPVDLFLCRHHYQLSKRALAAAGAIVLDTDGAPLPPLTRPPAPAAN